MWWVRGYMLAVRPGCTVGPISSAWGILDLVKATSKLRHRESRTDSDFRGVIDSGLCFYFSPLDSPSHMIDCYSQLIDNESMRAVADRDRRPGGMHERPDMLDGLR